MENSALTASFFDVKFLPDNNTITFDISAITTINDYVNVHFQVIVYGISILSQNISLCDDLGDYVSTQLCPISAGKFDVDSSYKVSDSIVDSIPGIAYTVPDLDARVRVVVTTNSTTNPENLACVEAILTNGKTVQTKYASWPIATVAGIGLITSGVVSIIGHSSTAAHIASNSLSLFIYFQNLAITSMMAVQRVPPIAAAWAQNFQWSMGIISTGFLQDIVDWYVQSTGGTSTSILSNTEILSISVQKVKRGFNDYIGQSLQELVYKTRNINHLVLFKRADFEYDDTTNDDDLYTTDEKSDDITSKILVLRGIQRVAYLANLEITQLFLTGIIFLLFFAFILICALALFKAIIEFLIRTNVMKSGKFNEYRRQWTIIVKGTLYRLWLLSFPQVSLLCLWQLTVRDSAGCVVIAVFLLAIVAGVLFQAAIKLLQLGRRSIKIYNNPAYILYGDIKILNKFGFLYVQYRADCYYWVAITLLYTTLRSVFIALIQNRGKVQAIGIIIVELIYFISLCIIRPFMDKRTNVYNILVHLVILLNAAIFLIFSNLFGGPAAAISISGIIFFVLNVVFSLFILVFTIITCALAILYKNPDAKYSPVKDDRVSFIPRAEGEENPKNDTELMALGATAMRGHQRGDTELSINNYKESNTSNSNTNSNFDTYTSLRTRSDSLNIPAVQPASAIGSLGNNQQTGGLLSKIEDNYDDYSYKGNNNYVDNNSKTPGSSGVLYQTTSSYPYNAQGRSTNDLLNEVKSDNTGNNIGNNVFSDSNNDNNNNNTFNNNNIDNSSSNYNYNYNSSSGFNSSSNTGGSFYNNNNNSFGGSSTANFHTNTAGGAAFNRTAPYQGTGGGYH
ncbi:flavin adenine dinucleotide transporter FLC2 [Ascoidea rubescens DSM 1968]|uniref:TRP-domain-containing protein n=1 Tax=Ascoidea rubescens DSM 1968 TaxID=1344418 RepID=A0A1D2VNK1_9ASCO|nr:TRP-domain-containing protein [Ascoidea rubescens DSM 1968]ODV63192.1 TRP-domain-containing protein [Ascoidea rubescens DSM 1968]